MKIKGSPVAHEKLKIFISGKLGELDNETAVVYELIEEFGREWDSKRLVIPFN
jgi:hypothetical protein